MINNAGTSSRVESLQLLLLLQWPQTHRHELLHMCVHAGIVRDSSFARMTKAQWDEVHRVHLEGTMRCVLCAEPTTAVCVSRSLSSAQSRAPTDPGTHCLSVCLPLA